MSKRSWAVSMVLAAGLAATVEAAPAGFKAAGESAHFTFYTMGEAKVNAKANEQRLERIAHLLGLSSVPRAELYGYERAEDVAAVTGQYAGGVTYPALRQVHSTEGSLDHEMVHLVAAQLGSPGTFFQEGLAVALGDKGRLGGRKADDMARPLARRVLLRALLAGFAPQNHLEHYAVAGSFVAWLIQQHGIERLTAFFQTSSAATRDDAFRTAFGQTLDDAGVAWTAQL